MLPRRLAAWAVLALVLPALAGCASKETPASTGSVDGGRIGGAKSTTTSSSSSSAEVPPPPPITGTSARWHFHDYWKGHPTITLTDQNVTLTPTLQGLSAVVELPQGVIVPPETGLITINLSWASPSTGVINLTYRPSDSVDFLPYADAESGHAVRIFTTESNCDVPHRQKSLWAFNLTAKPSADPATPGFPTTQLRLVVQATIGRPLFIDPPHFDWWRDSEVIDLVRTTSGELSTLASPAANATIPDPTSIPGALGVPPTQDNAAAFVQSVNRSARIPATPGRIVPEGATNVVVLLNWSAKAPQMPKLTVTYEEQNNPSSGELPVTVDGDQSRIFVLAVRPPQTDTTYSNRTTWQFHVIPEGDPAGAFEGSYQMTAWVTRLSGAEAVKIAQGGAPSGRAS